MDHCCVVIPRATAIATRQCPRPYLQRQLCRSFVTSRGKAEQKVSNEGPLYRLKRQQKDEAHPPKGQDTESVKPETLEQPSPADPAAAQQPHPQSSGLGKKNTGAEGQQNDPLLQEATISSKEQRKADWLIIKEMTQYLWPKDNLGTRFRVGASVGLLIGAKVRSHLRKHVAYEQARLLRYAKASGCTLAYVAVHIGLECSDPILLQIHC